MKTILTLFITFCALITSVQAETIMSCKKRNPWVYTSYYWVQIQKNPQGMLTFLYGNGVDSQMVDVYFMSPVTQTAEGKYEFQSDEYALTSEVVKSKLSFTLKNKTQTVTRNKFDCE